MASVSGIQGGARQASSSNNEPSQTTELDAALSALYGALQASQAHVRGIFHRVVPPVPPAPNTGTAVAPVATTYLQKIGQLSEVADDIRLMLSDIDGRI